MKGVAPFWYGRGLKLATVRLAQYLRTCLLVKFVSLLFYHKSVCQPRCGTLWWNHVCGGSIAVGGGLTGFGQFCKHYVYCVCGVWHPWCCCPLERFGGSHSCLVHITSNSSEICCEARKQDILFQLLQHHQCQARKRPHQCLHHWHMSIINVQTWRV